MKFHDNKIVIAKCPACQATTKVTLEAGRAAIHCPRCKRQLPLSYAHSYQSQKQEAQSGAESAAGGRGKGPESKKKRSAPTAEVEYAAIPRTFTQLAFWIGGGVVVLSIFLLGYFIWQKPAEAGGQEYLKNVRDAVAAYPSAIEALEGVLRTQDQARRGELLKTYRLKKGEIDALADVRRHLTALKANPELGSLTETLVEREQRLAVLEKQLGLNDVAADVKDAVNDAAQTKSASDAALATKLASPNPPAQPIRRVTDPTTILIMLPGVTANEVNDVFLKRFSQLADRPPGQVVTKWAGDLLTLEVKPVANPATYAAKVDFGKLVYLSLAERSMTLQVNAERVANIPNIANDPLTTLLVDLKERDKAIRLSATLDRLVEMKPDHRQAEVTAALGALINDSGLEVSLREKALKLLPTWAGPDATVLLEKYLEDKNTLVRWAAMKGLAQLRAVGSAPALVKHWDKLDSEQVTQTLIALGPTVEVNVLPFLHNTSEAKFRIQACGVLKEIGTSQSLKPLLDIVNDKAQPAVVVGAAKEAMQAILSRDH